MYLLLCCTRSFVGYFKYRVCTVVIAVGEGGACVQLVACTVFYIYGCILSVVETLVFKRRLKVGDGIYLLEIVDVVIESIEVPLVCVEGICSVCVFVSIVARYLLCYVKGGNVVSYADLIYKAYRCLVVYFYLDVRSVVKARSLKGNVVGYDGYQRCGYVPFYCAAAVLY